MNRNSDIQDSIIVSTCSLFQHVAVTRVIGMTWGDVEVDYLRLPPEFIDPHSGIDLSFGFVEGWALVSQFGYILNAYPVPDADSSIINEAFEDTTVVVFHILQQDILRADIFPLVFIRWSPAGTKRFFPLKEAVQQRFRKCHSNASWEALRQAFYAVLVEGLNDAVENMPKQELQAIETLNSRFLTVDEDRKFQIDPRGVFMLSETPGEILERRF
jgi:hypothetical protein